MIRSLGAFVSILMSAVSANAESGSHELWRACDGYEPGKSFIETGAPEGAERFIGAYRGKWANQLDHVLIIDRIAADGTVSAYYAWARYPYWGIEKDACERHTGTFRNGTVSLRISREKEARYALSPDGLLVGEYQLRGSIMIGLFHRFDPMRSEPETPFNPPEKLVFPSGYTSTLVETGLLENGEPIRLQLIISKPDGPGPFPLLVFNHGSTGRGDVPAAARAIHLHHPIARHFLEKGWMIVSPQRRGRGWSEGLYDEGFLKDRSRYSGEPRVTLAGFDRAVADIDAAMSVLLARNDVDPSQVIMGGESRGGILSLAYAGRHPGRVHGVLNFVGGWLSTWYKAHSDVHQTIAMDAARSAMPTLWLYGGKDQLYGINDTRPIFDAFKEAGGVGQFVSFPNAGHGLMGETTLWKQPVDRFMKELGFPEFAK